MTLENSSELDWVDLQLTPKADGDLCDKISPEELEWERMKGNFTYGLVEGIYPKKVPETGKLASGTLWVNTNEELIFDWRFWYPNDNEEPATLRVFVLLDERQLDNALPEAGLYNDLMLNQGDDLALEVKIPPLAAGVHDLIVIGIPYPENEPDVYGITIVIYRRITLIAEQTSSPFREISFSPLPAEGSIKRDDPSMAVELTLKKDGIDIWNWPNPWLQVQTESPTRFYALAGHADVTNLGAPQIEELETSFFSLLFFIDYEQVEVAPGQLAIYGRVDQDTAYARIPLEIPPLPEGKHRILVLRIDTPGVPVCLLNGDPKGRILPNSVYGRLVGLEVLPAK